MQADSARQIQTSHEQVTNPAAYIALCAKQSLKAVSKSQQKNGMATFSTLVRTYKPLVTY